MHSLNHFRRILSTIFKLKRQCDGVSKTQSTQYNKVERSALPHNLSIMYKKKFQQTAYQITRQTNSKGSLKMQFFDM